MNDVNARMQECKRGKEKWTSGTTITWRQRMRKREREMDEWRNCRRRVVDPYIWAATPRGTNNDRAFQFCAEIMGTEFSRRTFAVDRGRSYLYPGAPVTSSNLISPGLFAKTFLETLMESSLQITENTGYFVDSLFFSAVRKWRSFPPFVKSRS